MRPGSPGQSLCERVPRMDAERREFLRQFYGRKLLRLMGTTISAGLETVADLRRAGGPSPEEAGMALRGGRRRGPPDAEGPPRQGAEARQAPE